MTPIHELLARIRWDPEFGAAQFVIGYHDRLIRAEVKVPLESIRFTPGDILPSRCRQRTARSIP